MDSSIRDGATLVQSAADVIECIGNLHGKVASPQRSAEFRPAPEGAEPDQDVLPLVEELLGPSPVPVDEIVRLSGVPPGAVQLALLELDLAGRLDRHAGNKVSLR